MNVKKVFIFFAIIFGSITPIIAMEPEAKKIRVNETEAAARAPGFHFVGDDKQAVFVPSDIVNFYDHLRSIARYVSLAAQRQLVLNDSTEGISLKGFNKQHIHSIVLLLQRYKECKEASMTDTEIITQLSLTLQSFSSLNEYAVEIMHLFRSWFLPELLCQAIEKYIVVNLDLNEFVNEEQFEAFFAEDYAIKRFTIEEQLHLIRHVDFSSPSTMGSHFMNLIKLIKIISRSSELTTNEAIAQLYDEVMTSIALQIDQNLQQLLALFPDFAQIIGIPELQVLAQKLIEVLKKSVAVRQITETERAQELRMHKLDILGPEYTLFQIIKLDDNFLGLLCMRNVENLDESVLIFLVVDSKTLKPRSIAGKCFDLSKFGLTDCHMSRLNDNVVCFQQDDPECKIVFLSWKTHPFRVLELPIENDSVQVLALNNVHALCIMNDGETEFGLLRDVADFKETNLTVVAFPCINVHRLNDTQIFGHNALGNLVVFDVYQNNITLTFKLPENRVWSEDIEFARRSLRIDDNHVLLSCRKIDEHANPSNEIYLLLVNTQTGQIEKETIIQNPSEPLYYLGNNLLCISEWQDVYEPAKGPNDFPVGGEIFVNKILDLKTGCVITSFEKNMLLSGPIEGQAIKRLDDQHFVTIVRPHEVEDAPIVIKVYNLHGDLVTQVAIPDIIFDHNFIIEFTKIDDTHFLCELYFGGLNTIARRQQSYVAHIYIPQFAPLPELISFIKSVVN